MQARTKYALFLAALFVLVLALRLSVSFANGNPSYESYFTLLQAEEIRETGTPRYHDALSYEGRDYVFNPAFYYLVAFLSLFFSPEVVVKVLPNVLLALLVPLVYLISHRLTNARAPSLFAAFFVGFSPIIFSTYINTAHPLTLGLPLLALAIYGLLAVEQQPKRALVFITLLALISPLAWLIVATFLLFSLILLAERLSMDVAYYETALFTGLLTFWWTLVIYKRALILHGFTILTGNLPLAVRAESFSDFTLLTMIVSVGAVPTALGLYAIYHASYVTRSRRLFLVTALGLATLLFAFLKLLPLTTTLLVLSLVFSILSAHGIFQFSLWLRKTRFEAFRTPLTLGVLLFFVLTSLLPAIVAGIQPLGGPSEDELATMRWLSTQEGAVVLASPKNGFLINAVAHKPYVADEAFLLVNRPDRILEDIDTIYTTPFTVSAVELLSKYGVTHILLGPLENARYSERSALTDDRDCFPILHKGAVTVVYGVACALEVQQ
ncbi:hypothetical protein D6789_03970 [Candidatus Woesearchaeota archaeon]|nr:MAG: hypothetical protein D6789_03970 [Candidatus Woesearchaeota archaeon]